MTDTVKPYLVVDSDDKDLRHRIDTPEYQAFLAWTRSEGITPENARRCEVFDACDGKPPYAVLTMYELGDKGVRIYDEVTEEMVTYTDIVTLSSLPPLREVSG
ncbi:hypothetical protein [Nonomuraea sp. NPDC050643]|uniref:hypothetical protein n=1 Tax=Nonomuraea sp. NPDC050643 TaxID=3155660 RepID=UPI0033C9F144